MDYGFRLSRASLYAIHLTSGKELDFHAVKPSILTSCRLLAISSLGTIIFYKDGLRDQAQNLSFGCIKRDPSLAADMNLLSTFLAL